MSIARVRAKSFRALMLAPIVLAGWTMSGAALAATPDQICGMGSTGAASNEALADAANRAEAALARRGGPTRAESALTALQVADAQAASEATAQTLAAYCTAAGESMRLSRQGSQYQAQTYLLSAIRYAEQARAQEIVARAAYRLALATVGGPAAGEVRGATRSAKKRSPDAAQVVSEVRPASKAEGCAFLADPDLLNQPARKITWASLACAETRARAAGDNRLAALTGLRLSRFLLATADAVPAAEEELRGLAGQSALGAFDVAGRVPLGPEKVELIGRLIESAIEAGRASDPILSQAVSAMRVEAVGDPGGEAFAAALAGRLALARGDKATAAGLLREAIFIEGQRTQPLRMSDWLLLLSEAEPDRRVLLVNEAYRALESIRPLLPAADPLTEESTFALRMRPVFERAVEVQLGAGEASEDGVRIAAAQTIIEAYRQAEIQSAFGVDCVPPREPVKPAELRAGETLLYPILLEDRVELLLAAGGQGENARYERLPAITGASRDTVTRLVGEIVDSTSYGGDNAWRAPSRQLYDILIKPIEGRLAAEGTLVIVPDGPLRALPFAALMDPGGTFLVQKTRLSIAPALSYSQPGLDRTDRALQVVAASLQQEVALPAGTFSKLEGTSAEARVAAGVDQPGMRGRFIEDFRKADLDRALSGGRIDVLHLATHASFNGRSDRSFIVANGEAIPLADLRGLISQNRTRGDELDLLVLSACETAVGDDQASMGLAGAAVQAGARSALASLWQVNDAGTVELMKNFYANYRAGKSKSEALREAQLALITSGDGYNDPNIWAAFTLLGGWR